MTTYNVRLKFETPVTLTQEIAQTFWTHFDYFNAVAGKTYEAEATVADMTSDSALSTADLYWRIVEVLLQRGGVARAELIGVRVGRVEVPAELQV